MQACCGRGCTFVFVGCRLTVHVSGSTSPVGLLICGVADSLQLRATFKGCCLLWLWPPP